LIDGTGENDREDGAENSKLGVFFFEENFGTMFDVTLDDFHVFEHFFTALGNKHEFLGGLFLFVLFSFHCFT